ncbi:hypothetical protein QUC31_017854 [Theobroma cacao]
MLFQMVGKSGKKFEIPHFDGTNFALWKLKMHAVLVKDGCVVALLTKEDKPEDMTDKQFIEKDEMALANLQLDLEDNVLFNVEIETFAKGLWDKFKSIYEGKSLTNKIFLRRQLYNLKMRDGDSMQKHLNQFNALVSKLQALDVEIDVEEKASILLCSMPDSWDNLIMNLSHVKVLDVDSIVASLLTEEMRSKSTQSNPEKLAVLGMFDKLGIKFIGENRHLKVIKGIMVVAKGELKDNLYKLIGETLVREVVVAESDLSMIWHRRLGHMSDRGLQKKNAKVSKIPLTNQRYENLLTVVAS